MKCAELLCLWYLAPPKRRGTPPSLALKLISVRWRLRTLVDAKCLKALSRGGARLLFSHRKVGFSFFFEFSSLRIALCSFSAFFCCFLRFFRVAFAFLRFRNRFSRFRSGFFSFRASDVLHLAPCAVNLLAPLIY